MVEFLSRLCTRCGLEFVSWTWGYTVCGRCRFGDTVAARHYCPDCNWDPCVCALDRAEEDNR